VETPALARVPVQAVKLSARTQMAILVEIKKAVLTRACSLEPVMHFRYGKPRLFSNLMIEFTVFQTRLLAKSRKYRRKVHNRL
jgi:hypothetical protein